MPGRENDLVNDTISNFGTSRFQENQVTIECVIPEKYHRTVIGTKGANVQTITSEYDVQIKFPDRQQQQQQKEGAGGRLA